MNFSNLISKMFVLFIFMVVGFGCGKGGIIDEHTRVKFNKLVLYIFAPSLIISSALGSQLSYTIADMLHLMLYSLIYLLILMVFAFIYVSVMRYKGQRRGLFLFCCTYGNVMFMGIPVLSALYGPDAVFLVSIMSMVFNFLLYSVGILFIRGKQEGSGAVDWKSILLNPSLPATVIAFIIFIFNLRLPTAIGDVLTYFGNMVIPIAMMLIGVSLSTVSFKEIFGDAKAYIYCCMKLVIQPVLIFFICRMIISDPLFLGLVVVSAAMPTASICPIFCTEYGNDTIYSSKLVFISTLCSLVTIPVVVSLLLL